MLNNIYTDYIDLLFKFYMSRINLNVHERKLFAFNSSVVKKKFEVKNS
jgi:hypothetical protein